MPENTDTRTENSLSEQVQGRNDLTKALIWCVLAVVVVRSFIVEPFKIPSSSMVPSLNIGDHIFVSKFAFGLSVPFTKLEFLKTGNPHRGDVIVFLFPKDESLHYVKRLVGLPGDKIEIKGRTVIINGKPLEREPVTDLIEVAKLTGEKEPSGEFFREKLGDVTHFVRYSRGESDYSISNLNLEVPEGQFFMMGDNRDDSYDSRSWGFVPRENIKGKALMVWLSLDQNAEWGTLHKVRWSRFGTAIQ